MSSVRQKVTVEGIMEEAPLNPGFRVSKGREAVTNNGSKGQIKTGLEAPIKPAMTLIAKHHLPGLHAKFAVKGLDG